MAIYYTSEPMRNPKLPKKAIDYALDKLNPIVKDVGSEALNQLSTKIRPNKDYKRDKDGRNLDIHKMIGKLPKPYNSLENQVKFDPNSGEILKTYQKPTRKQVLLL